MNLSAANRLALQRINRSLNIDEASAIIRVGDKALLKLEYGQLMSLTKKQLEKIGRWERRWAYEEVRRAIFGTDYEHKGTLREATRVRAIMARRITIEGR